MYYTKPRIKIIGTSILCNYTIRISIKEISKSGGQDTAVAAKMT
jgi:hypothetical protein